MTSPNTPGNEGGDMVESPFVSVCCEGERCFCGAPAEHKVREHVFSDDPRMAPQRIGGLEVRGNFHELTAYICHEHFRQIMGPAADRRLSALGERP